MLDRKKTWFPDDWIAPGEFRFCQQGLHCFDVRERVASILCPTCQNPAAPDDAEFRKNLASERKQNGTLPLFWLK